MDTFENKPSDSAANAGSQVAVLTAECDNLRRLLVSALLLMIVVSGTINLYLLRQVKYARTDLNAISKPVTQMMAEYEKARPAMEQFIARAQDFGRTHPDFAPILVKYNLMSTGTPPKAVTAPVAAPAPAAAPAAAPKK